MMVYVISYNDYDCNGCDGVFGTPEEAEKRIEEMMTPLKQYTKDKYIIEEWELGGGFMKRIDRR